MSVYKGSDFIDENSFKKLSDSVGKSLDDLAKSVDGVVDSLKELGKVQEANRSKSADELREIQAKAKAMGTSTKAQRDALRSLLSDLQRVSDAYQESAQASQGNNKAQELAVKSVKELRTEYKKLKEEAEALDRRTASGRERFAELSSEMRSLDSAIKSSTSAFKKQKEVVEPLSGSYDALVKDTKDLERQLKSLPDAFGANADAAKRLKAQIDANKESLKNFGKEAKEPTKLVKGSIDELKARYKALKEEAESIDLGTDEFKRLSKELQDLDKTIKQNTKSFRATSTTFDAAIGSYRALSNENSRLKKELKELPDVWGKNAAAAERLRKQIDLNDKKLKSFDKGIGESFRNVGNYSSALNFGKGALSGFAGAIGGGIAAFTAFGVASAIAETAINAIGTAIQFSAEKFINFEFEIAKAGAIANATGKDFDTLKNLALELGSTTQFSASEAAQGIQFLGQAGFSTSQIVEALPATLNLAAAASIDLGKAADIASNVVSGFGLQAKDTGRVVDVLVKATTSANVNVEELAESVKVLAPAAKTLGVSVEESVSTIAALGNAGIKGSEATRALSSAFGRLADPPKKAQKALEKLGVQIFDNNGKFIGLTKTVGVLEDATKDLTQQQKLASLQQIFGAEAVGKFTTLLNTQKEVVRDGEIVTLRGAEALKAYEQEFKNAGGAAQDFADKLKNTTKGSITELQSALEGLGITLFEQLNPAFRSVVESLTDFVGKANEYLGQSVEDKIRDEQSALNTMLIELGNANTSQARRNELLGQLQKDYPNILQNLKDEGINTGTIAKQLDLVNKAFATRIILARRQAKVNEAEEDALEITAKQIDASDALKESIASVIPALNQAQRERVINAGDEAAQARELQKIYNENQNQLIKYRSLLADSFLQYSQATKSNEVRQGTINGLIVDFESASARATKASKQFTEANNDLAVAQAEAAKALEILDKKRKKSTEELRNAEGEYEALIAKQKGEAKTAVAGSESRSKAIKKNTDDLKKFNDELQRTLDIDVDLLKGLSDEDIKNAQDALKGLKKEAEEFPLIGAFDDEIKPEFEEVSNDQIIEALALEKEFISLQDDSKKKKKDLLDLELEIARVKLKSLELEEASTIDIAKQKKVILDLERQRERINVDSFAVRAGRELVEVGLTRNKGLKEEIELAKKLESEAETDQQKEVAAKRRAELETKLARKQFLSKLALVFIDTYLAELKATPPKSGKEALISAGQATAIASIAGLKGFEKGGLVEGGEQIIRINEKGEEFVANANATKRSRKTLELINRGELTDEDLMPPMAMKSIMKDGATVMVQQPIQIDYDRLGKSVASALPRHDLIKDGDSMKLIMESTNERQEVHIKHKLSKFKGL